MQSSESQSFREVVSEKIQFLCSMEQRAPCGNPAASVLHMCPTLNSARKSAKKAVALLVLRVNVYRVASSLAATGSSRDSQQRCRLPQGHRHRVQSNPNYRTAVKAHLRLGGVRHFRGRRQPLQQAARGGGLARVSPAGPPSLGCRFRRRLPERRPGAFGHSMEHAAQLVVAPTVPVTGIDSTVIA